MAQGRAQWGPVPPKSNQQQDKIFYERDFFPRNASIILCIEYLTQRRSQ